MRAVFYDISMVSLRRVRLVLVVLVYYVVRGTCT